MLKNRYILFKIINCIRFCGAFELALWGHDESDSSENPRIFRKLINFSAELDATLSDHQKNSSVFKGTFKEIQNDLLQCMLDVCHEQIIEEINNSPFLTIMADETMDFAAKTQLVVKFLDMLAMVSEKCDAETLSKTILTVIDPLIQNSPNKLIAQSFDGAAVISVQHAGVRALIKK
ncbi:unnamed protein product [Psylliodes chrysocephalus]|uniref:DUF4371 domain-containing protein n=1 Tax=Psylliodes chrysocephalus TaxID=3402493 RepID=A0A9P0D3X2_9CUCU|nr:unnamed protein product [Psylliodes chrysocephala]